MCSAPSPPKNKPPEPVEEPDLELGADASKPGDIRRRKASGLSSLRTGLRGIIPASAGLNIPTKG